MPGLVSDWGLWSMKNRQQLGIQEESKSSCCYSCSQKATAQIATSDSYMKTEITFFTDFFPLWFQQNFFHHSRACHSIVHDASGQHEVSSLDATVSKHWSNWKGYCRLLNQEEEFSVLPQFLPFTFSITGTKQQVSLRNILWEPSENGGSGLLMCPVFPMAEGAMVFLRGSWDAKHSVIHGKPRQGGNISPKMPLWPPDEKYAIPVFLPSTSSHLPSTLLPRRRLAAPYSRFGFQFQTQLPQSPCSGQNIMILA